MGPWSMAPLTRAQARRARMHPARVTGYLQAVSHALQGRKRARRYASKREEYIRRARRAKTHANKRKFVDKAKAWNRRIPRQEQAHKQAKRDRNAAVVDLALLLRSKCLCALSVLRGPPKTPMHPL